MFKIVSIETERISEEQFQAECRGEVYNGPTVDDMDVRELVAAGVVDVDDVTGSLQERLLIKAGAMGNEEVGSIDVIAKAKGFFSMVSNKATMYINKIANRESDIDKAMHDAKRAEIKARLDKTLSMDK